MAIFVLVHGAWGGGWIWRGVADELRRRGHVVFTPTLTGVGERSHLLGPDIDLDTQITDIVNVMKWEDLEDVVLVGHSYGGMVISGVAERMERAISSIVYLDAFYPDDGKSLSDYVGPGQAADHRKRAAAGEATPISDMARGRESYARHRGEADASSRQMLRSAREAHGRARPDRQEDLYLRLRLAGTVQAVS